MDAQLDCDLGNLKAGSTTLNCLPAGSHTWQVVMHEVFGYLSIVASTDIFFAALICAVLAFMCEQTRQPGLWSP